VRPVGVAKKTKKKKKYSGKLAIHADHPHRRIEVKVCMPCGLQCVVLKSSFIKIGLFAAVCGRKSPLVITLAIGLYNSLYCRTSSDKTLYRSVIVKYSFILYYSRVTWRRIISWPWNLDYGSLNVKWHHSSSCMSSVVTMAVSCIEILVEKRHLFIHPFI